jgi:hypothetical protein
MARSISVIKQQLIDQKNATPELSELNSTSQTAIWNLWLYIQAVAINIFEQLQDAYKIEIETIADSSIPNTDAWVQAQAFKFQYGDNIQLINLVPTYTTINATKQIITRCSVKTDNNRICQIKVAKESGALDSLELTALESYYNYIGNAGISYNLISAPADKIEIVAEVFYDAQFVSTISANVTTALNNYFANLSFDGVVYVSKIEDSIQGVTGVKDIKISEVNTRRSTQSYGTGAVVYNLSTGTNARFYQTYAGYIIEETETGHTFLDTITYTIS